MLVWISSFLDQRVSVDGVLSDMAPVKRGVPQGSVLGPLLFVIFINDLPRSVNRTVKVFADDTKIYRPVKLEDDITALQADLHNLEAWSITWQMSFNTNKFQTMLLGTRNSRHV